MRSRHTHLGYRLSGSREASLSLRAARLSKGYCARSIASGMPVSNQWRCKRLTLALLGHPLV